MGRAVVAARDEGFKMRKFLIMAGLMAAIAYQGADAASASISAHHARTLATIEGAE